MNKSAPSFDIPPGSLTAPDIGSTIRLSTFGEVRLFSGNQEVALASRKTLALLTYLSTLESGTESRERLAGLLWGDSQEDKARASLRQALSRLRELLPHEMQHLIVADRLDVHLNVRLLQSDHSIVSQDLNEAVVHEKLLGGSDISETFLMGYEDIDPGFRNWLQVFRQNYHDRLLRSLESLLHRATGDESRKRVGQAILFLDPTHEPACRATMQSMAALGDAAGALRTYNGLWTVLEDEFDSEPSTATQNLVAEIKLGHQSISVASITTNLPGPTLAEKAHGHALFVGNFRIDDIRPDKGVVVSIFRRELLAALARFRDWRVFDSVQFRADHHEDSFVIDADAYEDGEIVRFVLVLKKSSNGQFVWSERFAVGSDAWFITQQKIIRRLSIALDIHMSSDRLERVATIPNLSLDLFDRWLRGQQSIFKWHPNEEDKAEELFRSIVAEAPTFAPAYAGLAGILNSRHLIFPGVLRNAEAQLESLQFSKKAVELDPLDSRSHLHLAWSWALNGEYQRAIASFLLAFELNEGDPWTIVSASEGLSLCGDIRSSKKLQEIAEVTGFQYSELHWSYKAVVMFVTGNYDACINAASQSTPVLNCVGAWHSSALFLTGRTEEATEQFTKFKSHVRENWFGNVPPTDGEIIRWLLQCFPIAREDVRSRLISGVTGIQPELDLKTLLLSLPPTQRHPLMV
jgi:DNA-binding SARP family transcriptional activator